MEKRWLLFSLVIVLILAPIIYAPMEITSMPERIDGLSDSELQPRNNTPINNTPPIPTLPPVVIPPIITPTTNCQDCVTRTEFNNLISEMNSMRNTINLQSTSINNMQKIIAQLDEKLNNDNKLSPASYSPIIILGIAAFIFLALVIFVFYYKPKKKQENVIIKQVIMPTPRGQPPMQRNFNRNIPPHYNRMNVIKTYISENLRKKYPITSIKKALLIRGYNNHEIELGFKTLNLNMNLTKK